VRILGIDCGTERTGYGIVLTDGRRHELIAQGVITTRVKDPLASRLTQIAAGLRQVIAEFTPAAAAVEQVFHAANTQTALKLAHARGVTLLTLAEAGLAVGEYSPLEVKMSVVGYGRAEKAQVQLMVRGLLQLDQDLREDAADALAVAICHATHSFTRMKVGA
jgi:crossover junction endodeoxyribonuclease RuvC